jgi:molecular chaperone GrpE
MSPKPENEKTTCTNSIADTETSLTEKTKLVETYLSQLRFARADLENLQKHMQKRIEEGVTTEKAKLIMQILTVAEEVDLALDHAKKAQNSSPIDGLEMIRKKLWKIISCEGLCSIEAIGKPFNPHRHEAVLEIETGDCPEGMVVQEVRKGYLLNGEVFRPSLVNVSCSPSSVKVEKVNEK